MIFLNKRRVFQAFGNGDVDDGKVLLTEIANRLNEERRNTPFSPKGHTTRWALLAPNTASLNTP